MDLNIAIVAYLAPLILVLAALLIRLRLSDAPGRAFHVSRAAAVGAFVLMVVSGIGTLLTGASVGHLVQFGSIELSLRLDALSVVMSWLVTFLGVLLIQFSRNYLDGDLRQSAFLGQLCMTLSAVLIFVLAGSLWQLVIGWICTSLTLHQLLEFYADRPRAVHAARKKYIVARVADVCLILAALLIGNAFGTADIGRIDAYAAAAQGTGSVPNGIAAAAILLVIAAALKSAAFPFHGWLLEVMETPTPVSALLHAGLLNAGVFLIVRLGSVVALQSAALILLIAIGAVTAIVASSAMTTQPSVKISLAYSSAAHMGFMLMLCGFGAHSVVIMHLVAHSCYKAHAFLSSGSVVDYVSGAGSRKLNAVPRPGQIMISVLVAVAVLVATSWLLNIELTKRAGEFALAVTFAMAMTYLFVKGTTGQTNAYTIVTSTALVVLVTLAFWSLELTAAAALGSAVSTIAAPGASVIAAMVVALVAFGIVSFLSMQLPALYATTAWKSLYVHLKNGFYANALFDRAIARMRSQQLSSDKRN